MKITFAFLLAFFSAFAAAQSFTNEVAPSLRFSLSWVKGHPVPPPLFAYLLHLGMEGALDEKLGKKEFSGKFFRILEELEPAWKGLQTEARKAGILTNADSSSELTLWIENKKKNLAIARSPAVFQPLWDLSAWIPTPPLYSNPVLPNWGSLEAPRRLSSFADRLMPPHPLSLKHLRDFDEVRIAGDKTSYDQRAKATAEFWSADSGTVTPPGMWIEAGINTLMRDARSNQEKILVLRKLTRALGLAGILCWRVKYRTSLWRPITAIRKSGHDLGWLPRITTPPFPTYVSGHSTFSAAAATVLDRANISGIRFFGPNSQRYFSHPFDAAIEAGESRILGGIHFRFDDEDGQLLGQEIGEFVSL